MVEKLPTVDGVTGRVSDPPAFHGSEHTDGTDDIAEATVSTKGLMSATDWSKLDGIEAGADVTGSNPPQAHGSSHTDGSDDIADFAGAGTKGLVPDPTTATGEFLKDDGTWDTPPVGADEKVGVTASDTTPGYLNGKLVEGNGIGLTVGTPGGDETLSVAVDETEMNLDNIPDTVNYAKMTAGHESDVDAHHDKSHAHDGVDGSGTVDYDDLTNKLTEFPPEPHLHDDEDIDISKIGTPTYDNLEDLINITQSAGVIVGGEITDAGSGEVDVASGQGLIKSTDSEIGANLFFAWDAVSGEPMTDGINYVSVDYNGGTPQVIFTTTNTANGHTIFNLGTVYKEDSTLHIMSGGQRIPDLMRAIQQYLGRQEGHHRVSGLMLGETGTRNISVTSGYIYRGLNPFFVSAFDSSGTDRFSSWYLLNGVWTKITSQAQIDNLQYNDVSTPGSEVLANIGVAKYGVFWVYVEPDGHVQVLYGNGSFSVAEADALGTPSQVPPLFNAHAVLIGKIIIPQNGSSFEAVLSAFVTVFTPTNVINHNDTANLNVGDYLHLTSAEYSNVGTAISLMHTQNTDTGTNATDFSINGSNAIKEGDYRLTDARTPTAHKDTHKSGGSDAFGSTDVLEAVSKRLQESGTPTILTMGAVTDGQYLKRSGTSIVGDSGGGSSIFGSEFAQTSSDAEATNATNTFSNKINYTTPSLTTGRVYRIAYTFQGKVANPGEQAEFDVQVAGSSVVHEPFIKDNYYNGIYGGFFYYTAPSDATTTVVIRYKVKDSTTGTAYIRNARVELWRVA